MDTGDFRTLPVMKDGTLVGIISDRDIRKYWQKPETIKVGAVMTERPICVSADDSVAEALRMLLAFKVGGLPVIRQHKVVGVITTTYAIRVLRSRMVGGKEFNEAAAGALALGADDRRQGFQAGTDQRRRRYDSVG